MSVNQNAIQIHQDDNVWICLKDMKQGDTLTLANQSITLMKKFKEVIRLPINLSQNVREM